MRRITRTNLTREECLRRALEKEWLSEGCSDRRVEAVFWDEARYWRSLALVARPAAAGKPAGDA